MFFILSKTLYYLILPYTIIGICLILSLIVKRKGIKQKLLWLSFILFWLFGNNFIANTLLKSWELDPVLYEEISKKYAYGVVLTGVLHNERLPEDRPHFEKGADRIFHTYQLYNKDIIDNILVSGGSGKLIRPDYIEAEKIKDVFIEMGVPEKDIIIEGESRNTAESSENVAEMLINKNAANDFILITSAFHMRRSRDSFQRQLNEPVDIFPVDYYSDPNLIFIDYFVPTFNGLQKWHRLMHEVTGYIAYDLVGYI